MIRRPPISTLTDPPCPYTTLFRSFSQGVKFALGKAALRSGHDRPGPCIPRGAGTNRLQRLGDRPSLAPLGAHQETPLHRPVVEETAEAHCLAHHRHGQDRKSTSLNSSN